MTIDIAKVNSAFKERKRKPGEAAVPPVEQTAISREAHPGENDKLLDINKKLRSACKRPKQSVRKIN